MTSYRFYRPVAVTKARRTTRKPNGKQVRFEDKMTAEVNSNVGGVLDKLKSDVTTAKEVERLYRAGKAKKIADLFDEGSVKDFFANTGDLLEQAVRGGSKLAAQAVRPGVANQSQLGLSNDAINDYTSTRTGALIRGVKEDTQVIVQDCVRVGLANAQSPAEIASNIMAGIGLDPQRARAVASYTGKEVQEFAAAMTEQRAMMIARTEVSFAVNHGQVLTWQNAIDDGLMGADSKKVWITDPNPCPKICALMDGVEVALDEEFVLPDGVEVVAPPAHPNCRCQVGALEDGGVKPTSGRERDDDEDASEADEAENDPS